MTTCSTTPVAALGRILAYRRRYVKQKKDKKSPGSETPGDSAVCGDYTTCSGIRYPLSFFSSQAMFSPRRRIVSIPSSSRSTSPISLPIPTFQ